MKAVKRAGIGRKSRQSKNECNPRWPGKSAGGSEKRCNGRQGNSCPAVTNRIVDLRRIRASICPLSRAANASLRLRIPGQNIVARTQDPKSGEREHLTEAQVERHDIAAPTLSSRLGLGRSKEAKNAWKRRSLHRNSGWITLLDGYGAAPKRVSRASELGSRDTSCQDIGRYNDHCDQ